MRQHKSAPTQLVATIYCGILRNFVVSGSILSQGWALDVKMSMVGL
jgi:hypothetical protein